jgi:hypothetical protein
MFDWSKSIALMACASACASDGALSPRPNKHVLGEVIRRCGGKA